MYGIDRYTGQSYEHRRDWVESRLLALASVFAIDICAYALLFNRSGSHHLYQQNIINKRVKETRLRLMDISWFIRVLNEPVAPVGTLQELDAYCKHLERKRRQGAANCQRWLDSA